MKKKQIYCNHRTDDNSRDCLVFNSETGYCLCSKCGANFKPLFVDDIQETKAKEVLNQLDELLNNLKLVAVDSPELMNEINKQCKAAHKLRKLPKLAQASSNHAQSKFNNFCTPTFANLTKLFKNSDKNNKYNKPGLSYLSGEFPTNPL